MKKLLLFIIIFISFNTLSRDLYVTVLPVDTYQLDETVDFFNSRLLEEMKGIDSLLVIEPTTSNIVLEFSLSELERSKRHGGSFNLISKVYKSVIEEAYKTKRLEMETVGIISPAVDKNNLISNPTLSLRFLADLKKAYYEVDTIKFIFLGDSYNYKFEDKELLHSYPSYSFISDEKSPFKLDNVINGLPIIEVSIFYLKTPYYSSRIQDFYDLLLQKYFNTKLQSFNDQFSFSGKKISNTASYKHISPNKMAFIDDKTEEACIQEDDFDVVESVYVYSITGTLNNTCRKHLSVDFKLVNVDGYVERPVAANEYGTAEVTFDLSPGLNELFLRNNQGIYRKVWTKDIKGGNDNLRLVDMSDVDGMVKLMGQNKFRQTGQEVEILKNGLQSTANVIDGKFEKIFDLKKGDNKFSVKQLDGSYQEIVKSYTTECNDKITVDESKLNSNGDFFGVIENSCRKDGSIITITYDEKEYHARVYDGIASFEIPLHNRVNDLYYKDREGNIKGLQYEIREFDNLVKVSIYWNAPSLLDLHVFEPDYNLQYPVDADKYSSSTKQIVEKGHLQSINKFEGVGRLTIDNIPSADDIKNHTFSSYGYSYTAKFPKGASGDIHVYVDNVNRHLVYAGPTHCKERSRGGVEFSYMVLINGSLDTGDAFINPATCTESLNSETGSMGWFADKSSKLFKKVIVKSL